MASLSEHDVEQILALLKVRVGPVGEPYAIIGAQDAQNLIEQFLVDLSRTSVGSAMSSRVLRSSSTAQYAGKGDLVDVASDSPGFIEISDATNAARCVTISRNDLARILDKWAELLAGLPAPYGDSGVES